MREHLQVAFGTESQFIWRYYKRVERYGDLRVDANLRRLVTHILRERWFQRSRKFNDFETSEEAILADVAERSYSGVLRAVFGQLAKHLDMPRWGDKTPEYNYHLEMLDELFPDARFVHVVRDGRDVAMSLEQIYFGPNNIYLAATDWQHQIRLVDAFIQKLSSGRFIEVRYEDLLAQPVETFLRLAEFIEYDKPTSELTDELERELVPKLNRANSDKWKTQMTAEQQRLFDGVACRELKHHGYEALVDESDDPPALTTRAWWRCQSKLNNWKRSKYWREHFYRVNLRAQDMLRSAKGLFS